MVLPEELDIGGTREEIQANCLSVIERLVENCYRGAKSMDGFRTVSTSDVNGMICDILKH